MSAMTKRRLSILLAVIAIAIEVTMMVLLVPVMITGVSGGIVNFVLPAVLIGLALPIDSGELRRPSRAVAHQANGA